MDALKERCEVCRFVGNGGTQCQRHAPTSPLTTDRYAGAQWPSVLRDYWCGDFVAFARCPLCGTLLQSHQRPGEIPTVIAHHHAPNEVFGENCPASNKTFVDAQHMLRGLNTHPDG